MPIPYETVVKINNMIPKNASIEALVELLQSEAEASSETKCYVVLLLAAGLNQTITSFLRTRDQDFFSADNRLELSMYLLKDIILIGDNMALLDKAIERYDACFFDSFGEENFYINELRIALAAIKQKIDDTVNLTRTDTNALKRQFSQNVLSFTKAYKTYTKFIDINNKFDLIVSELERNREENSSDALYIAEAQLKQLRKTIKNEYSNKDTPKYIKRAYGELDTKLLTYCDENRISVRNLWDRFVAFLVRIFSFGNKITENAVEYAHSDNQSGINTADICSQLDIGMSEQKIESEQENILEPEAVENKQLHEDSVVVEQILQPML